MGVFVKEVSDKKIKDLGEIPAEEFNKIWDDTFDDFKKAYHLELV